MKRKNSFPRNNTRVRLTRYRTRRPEFRNISFWARRTATVRRRRRRRPVFKHIPRQAIIAIDKTLLL